MATIKVKLCALSVEGRAGRIFYQIIHNCIIRQIKTNYRLIIHEWNDVESLIDNIGDLVPPVAEEWYRRFTLSDFS